MIFISALTLEIFFAKQLILIFPFIIIAFWFWGSSNSLIFQRAFVCKTTLTLSIGLVISGLIGCLFPQDRPFMFGLEENFLLHAPTPSFPSNHATIAFTCSFGCLFWLRSWIGVLLFMLSLIISWARIFLGVHWVIDIAGAFIVSVISCGITQIFWENNGYKLLPYFVKYYQLLCSVIIRKGWIKG